jgi:hypothetical protein
VTPSEIEPVTFWLEEQCLNQMRHRVHPALIRQNIKGQKTHACNKNHI